ncbi:MAG: hypothetical protein J5I50_10150 [Chitinophagaceae bacterium]|nr:hypothetical protein [Chitinophagaceae bacterium]
MITVNGVYAYFEMNMVCHFRILSVISLFLFTGFSSPAQVDSGGAIKPSDPLAGKSTISLLEFLDSICGKGVLFGQHHASVESQSGWRYTGSEKLLRSDVFDDTGDHPAIFGFDLSRGIATYREHVIAIHRAGGIITFSWHALNPVTGGSSKDKSGSPVESILPEGSLHKQWLVQLDELADFFLSLEEEGEQIPVIFRPFHENTGGWFWWGKASCSPNQFKELWQMTIDYLRKTRNVHNLLIAYSPSRPSELPGEAISRYPGDDYVDIIGSDLYAPDNEKWPDLLVKESEWITEMAKNHKKIAALTEVGVKEGLNNTARDGWFTERFLNLLKGNPTIRLAYVLTWRNSDPGHYWVPIKGQPNYEDFLRFYSDPYTLFLSDIQGNKYQN